jgi:hypothetical protein
MLDFERFLARITLFGSMSLTSMSKLVRPFIVIAVVSLFITDLSFAQPKTPPPPPPTFMFNLTKVKFGAQSIGVQSCIYVTITNTTAAAQTIKKLYVADKEHYAVPSPSPQMMPMVIQANGSLVISICFKPNTLGDHDSYLTLIGTKDSLTLPIQGKGLKSEDIAKLPKNDLVVIKPAKKKKDWTFKVELVNKSKVTLQLFDELGILVQTYSNNDVKPEGVTEFTFDETDKGKKKLPAGNYYLRAVYDEVGKNAPQKFTKLVKVK